MVEFPSEETDKLVSKEIFADLYPFIDNDTVLQRDDFYENMLKAFEYDGKLYQTISCAHMYGWVAKRSQLDQFGQWGVDSLREYLEENPNANIFIDTSGEDILQEMVLVSSSELMDWSQKSCNFESDTFLNIMELAKQYGTNRASITSQDRVPALLDNRLLFVETPISIETFCAYNKVLQGDMAVVTSPFSGREGVNLYTDMPQIGIIEKSKHRDGAWQFARLFFTKQGYVYFDTESEGFPVRKDRMEDLLRIYTATEEFELDGTLHPAMTPDDYSYGWDGFDIELGWIDKDVEEQLRGLFSNASQKQEIDSVIKEIILEESKPYFAGEKDAEEVAKIIQGRVTTYMNE